MTEEDDKLLDELADAVAKRRLTPAAVFFLESVKPLGWLGAKVLLFFRPMVSLFWHDPVKWDRLQKLLEERGTIENLLQRLEARY